MPRKLISSGSRFEAEVGYSRAVVDGDFVFVSGCTGYDYATMTISDDIVAQCEQTFKNIESALAKADAKLADIVRAQFILPSRTDWPACWPTIRKYFGDVRPASTMIVAGLVDERIKIEIEVTARRST
jgi:enamine deaminase RidA (YjgF/YER057c/UK114 family)